MGSTTSEVIEQELFELNRFSRQWTRRSETLFEEGVQLEKEAKWCLQMGRRSQAKHKLELGARKEMEAKSWARRASQIGQLKERVLQSHMSYSFAKSAVRLSEVFKSLDTRRIDQELALFSDQLDQLGDAGDTILDEQDSPLDVNEKLKMMEDELALHDLPFAPPVFQHHSSLNGGGREIVGRLP
jgi:hypothetical protein